MSVMPEAAAAADRPPADPTTTNVVPTVRASVDARGVALTILATVAVVGALDLAQSFFVSLLLGILIAYTLNPLVAYLERIRLPRAVGTIVVMVGLVAALAVGGYSLRGQMQAIIEQLPVAARTLSSALARLRSVPGGNMQKMQSAAAEVEKATADATGGSRGAQAGGNARRRRRARVQARQPPAGGLHGCRGVPGPGDHGAVPGVLPASRAGTRSSARLVRLAGPSLSHRRITVTILDDINDSIQKYLFMLLVTNVLVGLLSWAAFRAIGLDNAGAWAVASGLLHVIPYLGPGVTAVATGMAAFMQFDSFAMALLVGGASLAIATLVGTFITTWMTGRIAHMNSAAVFVSLLFWGWLWGVWGMLAQHPDRRHRQGHRAARRATAAGRRAARRTGLHCDRRPIVAFAQWREFLN